MKHGGGIINDFDGVCPQCGLERTVEGHDGCLGTIPGLMNACCGHGGYADNEPYAQFLDGSVIRGQDATDLMEILKRAEKSHPNTQEEAEKIRRTIQKEMRGEW